MPKRNAKRKYTDEVSTAIRDYILRHPSTRDSPIANDILLVNNYETGQKERVHKVLLFRNPRELLLDLHADVRTLYESMETMRVSQNLVQLE